MGHTGTMHRAVIQVLAVLTAAAAWAQNPQAIAIRDAAIVTVSGETIAKGTLVIRDGLIEAAGADTAIPPGAWIIDGQGLTVYPGLIDAASSWGMPANLLPGRGGRGGQPAPPPARGPEDRPASTTWVKAADEFQTADPRLERARAAGFTSAVVFPMRGIFCGQGAVINLAGDRLREMVIEPSVGQFLTMTPARDGFPAALMGVIAYIRQIYLDAQYYTTLKDAYARDPRGMRRPDYDRVLEGVLESKRVLLPANRAVEIDRMIHFAAELHQPAVLYGMQEGYRATEALKPSGAPVLVSLKWPERPRDANPDEIESRRTLEVRERAPSTPAELVKAGVRFAFYSDGLDQPRDLQKAVKKAIDAGLSRQDAVKALTLEPAEIFGVSDRLGSIEKGKIANLVVTRGELFDDMAKIEMVFIDGRRYLSAPGATAPPGTGPVTRENAR
jgi:imidazolonepropionase-like amidohydrolase